jgi:hypothetical protein
MLSGNSEKRGSINFFPKIIATLVPMLVSMGMPEVRISHTNTASHMRDHSG